MPGLGVSPPVRTLPQALLRGVEGGQELSKPSCVCRVGAWRSSWVQVLSWRRGQRGRGNSTRGCGTEWGTGLVVPQPTAERCHVPAEPAPDLGSAAQGAGSFPAAGREPGTSLAARPSASLRARPNCTKNERWKGVSLSHARAVPLAGQARFHPAHGILTMPRGCGRSQERARSVAGATYGASRCINRSWPRCRCRVQLNSSRTSRQMSGMGRCSLCSASQPRPEWGDPLGPSPQPPTREGRGAQPPMPEEGKGGEPGWAGRAPLSPPIGRGGN